ncbi:MAG: PfkB family carbohydrate kinase [Alistipes finegoldii]
MSSAILAPTGVALITVDNSAENCIVVAPGANARLSRKDIDDVRPELAKAGYLLIQLEIPLETVEYAIQTAAELGVRVILNPVPAALDEKYLKYVYLLTPNESECALLRDVPY